MPAVSESQRRLFGAALGAKRGGRAASPQVAKLARTVSEAKLRDFARKPGKARGKRRSKRSG